MEKNYNTSWVHTLGRESLVFWVQTCNDAHLSLATVPGWFDNYAYEVVIGERRVSWSNGNSSVVSR